MTGRVLSRGICVCGIALLGIVLPTERAAADPITTVLITSGSMTVFNIGSGFTEFDFAGTQGFSLRGSSDNSIVFCSPCRAGQTQGLSAPLTGSFDGGSTGTFQGQTYAFNFFFGGARMQFDAPPSRCQRHPLATPRSSRSASVFAPRDHHLFRLCTSTPAATQHKRSTSPCAGPEP
jgi:hypothetical protein